MPNNINIFTEHSAWFLLLCLALGAGFALLLYSKKYPWTKPLNQFLRLLRFTLITLLSALLIGFMLKQVLTKSEKPTVVLAIDNSASLAMVRDSSKLQAILQKINETALALKEKGFETEIFGVNDAQAIDDMRKISFVAQSSDLGKMLKNVQSQYENRNLHAVVLMSDGIQNQGLSVEYQNYNFNLHTVGVGDTIQRKDMSIKNVFHNKIAYLGNQFPISVEFAAFGYVGKNAVVNILKDGQVLKSQTITLKSDAALQKVDFLLTAEKSGLQQYQISLAPFDDEFSKTNNTKQVYIEIIDNKEKILLLAAAPHPDIKVIRSAIEKNENYDFELMIPGLSENKPQKNYDLVIFFHVPNPNVNAALVKELIKKSKAQCYIVGGNIQPAAFNQLNTGLTLQVNASQTDKVFPELNSSFSRFSLDEDNKKKIGIFPPISVLYGEYVFSGQTDILLYQKVGRVVTKKPILALTETSEGNKTGFLIGDGFWQWRLQEYAVTNNQQGFDQILTKFLQYVSTKNDKTRFRVSTGASEYHAGEAVNFQVEVYDAIYEKMIGQKIDLEIIGKSGFKKNYSFTNAQADFYYLVEGLEEGIYNFSAKTILDEKTEVSKGQFIIKDAQIEGISVKADFDLLKNLATRHKGNFYHENDLEALKTQLLAQQPIAIAQISEEFDDILRLPYIFIFLLFLASLEWFLRKFKGGY